MSSSSSATAKNQRNKTLHKIFEEGKKKGWEEKTIEDITKDIQYGYTASAKPDGNSKLLRITDIQNSQVDWNNVPFCECKEIDKYRLVKGDIVFARTGATVGKSFLINEAPENSIFASYLILAKSSLEKCLPEFLYYFFQSPGYWSQITEQKAGGAQPNVNGTKLKKLKLVVPSLSEQKKIVEHLHSLSQKVKKIQELQQKTEEELKELEQSILDKAFKVN